MLDVFVVSLLAGLMGTLASMGWFTAYAMRSAVDVRIVAATHQPLEQRVAQNLFREDLFHRLNVIRLRLPALRERREDIPALVELFMRESANSLGIASKPAWTSQAEN